MPHATLAQQRALLSPWLPAGGFLLFLLLGGLFWASAQRMEQQQNYQLLAQESELAVNTFNRAFTEQLMALQRQAARLAINADPQEALWRADAQLYLQHHANFQAIEWIDTNNIIRWIEPQAGNEASLNFNVAFNETRRIALRRAARSGLPDVSEVVTLQSGGLGLIVYYPVGRAERFNGFVAAVFQLETLFSNLLSPESRHAFRWHLTEKGQLRFQLTPETPLSNDYIHSETLTVFGPGWQLEAVPTQTWVNQQQGSYGQLAFGILALTGALLSGAARVSQIAMAREQDLLLARMALQTETSQRQAIEADLERLNSNDALTGLVNQRFFLEELHQILLLGERKQRPVALIVLDLDGFQQLNETFGHESTDELLVRVAQRLTRLNSETVTIGRASTDKFLISKQNIANLDEVIALLDQITLCLQPPFALQGQTYTVSATCGVSTFPDNGDTTSILLRNAHAALARAQETNRGGYQFFATGMHERARQRLELDKGIRQALATDEFVLYLQPQLDLATGQVGSVEALIRWIHPQRGLILPLEFIPAAVESGLITEIGRWVIRAACRQLARWNGTEFSHLRIAVNLSGRELDSPDLVGYVARALSDNNIEPGRLELELTEEIFVQNIDCNLEQLTRLNALGVHLAIDDFGVGYSSLSYLKNFPVNLLKIDRSFIKNVAVRHDDAVITRAVINLAHNLGIQVVAEGIETEAQLNFLRSHRCDFVQGYLISKPMPINELEEKIRQNGMSWPS